MSNHHDVRRNMLWIVIVLSHVIAGLVNGGIFIRKEVESSSSSSSSSDAYLPIVLIHGINNVPHDWDLFVKAIKKARGNNQVLIEVKSMFDGIPGSWVSLPTQVAHFRKEIFSYKLLNGFDLICHSQGAVICRELIETTFDLGVKSFISLAGPHVGVYGDGFLKNSKLPVQFDDVITKDAYLLAYQDWAQILLSPAQLWHDPFHEDLYYNHSVFLPQSLGMKYDPFYSHQTRKENFCTLNKAVFLVGEFGTTLNKDTFDMGIDPWFSGIFSYYDKEGKIIPMHEQEFYKKDYFGLKQLAEEKKLVLHAVKGVKHDDWIYDSNVIIQYVVPHLSQPVVMEEASLL